MNKLTCENRPLCPSRQQRGRFKEQQFVQKVQEMLLEEENKRIHIAQGLPWTTDEPEVCFTNLIADWEIATYECSYCFLMAVAY